MRADPAFFLRRGEQIVREHAAGLPQAEIIRGIRVATQFNATRVVDDTIASGASRFGGRPDLPAAIEWPRWDGFAARDVLLPDGNRFTGKGCAPGPLSFLAQLNLADIPDADGLLPDTGWLCFFYDAVQQPWGFDPANAGCARIMYFDGDAGALARRDPPADLSDDGRFSPSSLASALAPTLPRWDFQIGLELPEPDSQKYWDLSEEVIAGREPHHRLFGWPKQIQDDMDGECHLVTNGIYCGGAIYDDERAKQIEGSPADWIMLLQLDTDEDGPGWSWGDNGCLYFWMRQQDLAARRFDKAWAILQCY